MTSVAMREFAILVQFSSVSPGSVGRPGTNVMYKMNRTSADTKDRINHEPTKGSLVATSIAPKAPFSR